MYRKKTQQKIKQQVINIILVLAPIEEVQDERNPSKKPERAFTPKEKNRQPDPNRWFGEHIRARSGVTPPTLDKSLKSLSEALTVEDMPVIRAKVDRQTDRQKQITKV